MTAVDRRRFFDIMGSAPTAVTVVTTVDVTGHPRGLTVAAVTSVSADPPSLLVCVDQRSRTLPDLLQAGCFAVNFLRGDRAEVARRFAAPLADRFAGVEWRPGSGGVPILHADALAWAECRTEQVIHSGDHAVLVAAVLDGSTPPPLSRPLMYFRHHFEPWSGEVVDRGAVRSGARLIEDELGAGERRQRVPAPSVP
ncbi:hypothetical protein BH23CHL8_BH23CHL8_13590 [soil metagenome]